MSQKNYYHNSNWKKSALGSAIEIWASSTLDHVALERPIILLGGIHGDEPEGVRLAQDTLKWLISAHETKQNLVPWITIPCVNVDGFKKGVRVNGRGVDLNRNYPARDWNPEAKAERYFPGPHPASEPEIQAVVELIRQTAPRLIIHCHSWKPCIVATGDLSTLDAKRLSQSSGYELMAEIGYQTPGSLSSFGWHDHKIPVICIEEQDGLSDLSSIWPRFERGMRAIFEDHAPRDPART